MISTELATMNILEFEQRVKRFATPENKGFVNGAQLQLAFKDTILFDDLMDVTSVENKLILSTFVCDFPIGSCLKEEEQHGRSMTAKKNRPTERGDISARIESETAEHMSVVDEYLTQIKE